MDRQTETFQATKYIMTRYCGREFTPKELEQIRFLIKYNPKFNRTRLSKEVCRILQWLKPDDKLKNMSCHAAYGKRWINTAAFIYPDKAACEKN